MRNRRTMLVAGAVLVALVAVIALAWHTTPAQAADASSVLSVPVSASQDDTADAAHNGPGHGGHGRPGHWGPGHWRPGHGGGGDGEPDDIDRFFGIVEIMPETGMTGTWQISGEVFTTTTETRFNEDYAPLAVGVCVKVVSYEDTPGIAKQITSKPDEYCQKGDDDDFEVVRAYGLIDDRPTEGLTGTWTISGTVYTATVDTDFSTWFGGLQVGACVLVETKSTSPDVAEKIASRPMYKCSSDPEDYWIRGTLFGEIISLPESEDLIGTWVVGSVPVSVTAETKLKPGDEPFEAGVFVKIHFLEQDGVKVAREVEAFQRHEDGGHDDDGNGCYTGTGGHAFGPIVSLPEGLIGTWDIGGVQYTVNDETSLDDPSVYVVGANVLVKYYTDDAGNRVAVRIKPTSDTGGGDGHSTFTLLGWVDDKPDGFIGVWTIGGEYFTTNEQTTFKEENGLLTETAYVRVVYRIEGDTRVVIKLETEVAPETGADYDVGLIQSINQDNALLASISAATSSDISGVWRIGGKEFAVSPATDLNDLDAALTVGSVALVNSYTAADGTRVATQIRAFDATNNVMVPFVQN